MLDGLLGHRIALISNSSIPLFAESKGSYKMRRFMTLAGLALVASLVLAAVGAASASAASEILLNGTNTFPQLILGLGGHISRLASKGGGTIECGHLLVHGSIRSKTDILLLLLWHGCKIEGTTTTCNSPNEPAGSKNIHDAVLLLPVLLLNKLPGLLAQLDSSYNSKHVAEVNCGAITIVVNGTVLGHIAKPANETFSNAMTLDILVKKAGEEQLWLDTEEKPNEIDHLESTNPLTGMFESSTEEVVEAESHLNAGIEAKFEG